ncbi:hypothetical protein D1094_11450 [Colwellia sp. RSH04]|nr:hypothetical protein D1094_11450 [Colwellia sp. RSH04]
MRYIIKNYQIIISLNKVIIFFISLSKAVVKCYLKQTVFHLLIAHNSHMLNIRKKISRLSREEYIKTVRGKGYILLQ